VIRGGRAAARLVIRGGRAAAPLVMALMLGCSAQLAIPPGASIACAAQVDCPADHACIDDRCISAAHECVVDVGGGTLGAAVDGTSCREAPNGVCVRGECERKGCGDGLVEDGEACDFGADNDDSAPDRCRTDCTLPRCGDGVVDGDESCDDASTSCLGCAQLCAINAADCDGAPGCECLPQKIFDVDGNFISGLVLDGDDLFVLAPGRITDDQIAVWRLQRDGSRSTILVDRADDFGSFFVDDAHVYYESANGGLARVAKDGGAEEHVSDAIFGAVDGAFVWTFDDQTGIERIDRASLAADVVVAGAIDGFGSGTAVAGVAWVSTDFGEIERVEGDQLVVVAERQFHEGSSVGLATDGRDLFWLDGRQQIWRLPLVDGRETGAPFPISDPPAYQRSARVFNLHADAAGLVYSAELLTDRFDGPGGIMEVAGKRAATMRARNTGQIHAVAADERSLCWPDDFSAIFCVPR
jgi:hypothetical protein